MSSKDCIGLFGHCDLNNEGRKSGEKNVTSDKQASRTPAAQDAAVDIEMTANPPSVFKAL